MTAQLAFLSGDKWRDSKAKKILSEGNVLAIEAWSGENELYNNISKENI